MPVLNTEINLKKQEHPHLFLNREELARVRELIRQEGSYQHKRFAQIKGGAEAWLAKPLAIPSQGPRARWCMFAAWIPALLSMIRTSPTSISAPSVAGPTAAVPMTGFGAPSPMPALPSQRGTWL